MKSKFWLLLAVSSLIAGCGGGSTPDSNVDSGNLRIAVIPKGTSNVYWQTVQAGARSAESELDGVSVLWKGPNVETNKDQQISIISDFIQQKVDGIVLAPQDAEAMVPIVERAANAQIPVVIMDSGVNTDQFISYVATDNYLGGQKAAEDMARRLNNKGKVVVIGNDPGGASTNEREKGFQDKIKSDYPEITIAGFQFHYNDRGKGRAVMEDFLTGHPDLNGVFCSNESSSIGALLAIQSARVQEQVTFIGFDSSDELVKGLETGDIDGIIQQDPFRIGYEGVKTMAAHLNGTQVENRVDTGVYVVTKENMNDPDIARLLKPDLSNLQ